MLLEWVFADNHLLKCVSGAENGASKSAQIDFFMSEGDGHPNTFLHI